MRRINNVSASFFLLVVAICWMVPHTAYGQSPNHEIWKGFSLEQKRYALFGFIDCHRLLFPHSNPSMYKADERVYSEVDKLVAHNGDTLMGKLILHAMTKTPPAAPDTHAELGGVDDGMLWRGLIEQEKEAYVQGVFWCAETASGKAISASKESVTAVVQKLNDWYLVSDEDWKDPRSGKRADVPVVSAMQKLGIISQVHAELGAQR